MVAPIITIAGIAVGLSVMTIIINKLLINEKMVNETREKMKELQKELKGIDPKSKEFQKKQDEILDMNMKIMKQQFKPMFVTFLPYIIVFYLIGSTFAFAPIDVGSQITLKIDGEGTIESPCLGINETISGDKVITAAVNSNDCKIFINGEEVNTSLIGVNKEISINKDNLNIQVTPPKMVFIKLPFKLPFIGNEIGWLGTYILISILTSTILNKALKNVYLRKWE
ncbi:MAG: DUF106 domain-containing protein [Nanoarchaeota archaeon]|nr:DUF106 domain-containing protein [Nanoarchaeota archaeon]